MTDLEKFIELYKSVGIELKPIITEGGSFLNLGSEEHKLFKGYSESCTQIYFDKDGKFVKQEFWE
jgi:hypothetical protein